MTIEIHTPELEALIIQRMKSGGFHSVEEVLLHALREKNALVAPTQAEAAECAQSMEQNASMQPRKNLAQFLLESPFAGSDLNLERQQDYGRPIEL